MKREKTQEHLGQAVCNTIEETSNAMLAAEADRACHAERYGFTNQTHSFSNVQELRALSEHPVRPKSPSFVSPADSTDRPHSR